MNKEVVRIIVFIQDTAQCNSSIQFMQDIHDFTLNSVEFTIYHFQYSIQKLPLLVMYITNTVLID